MSGKATANWWQPREFCLTTQQRIRYVWHQNPQLSDPKRWQELVELVRAYFDPALNGETIRRTACKIREEGKNSYIPNVIVVG